MFLFIYLLCCSWSLRFLSNCGCMTLEEYSWYIKNFYSRRSNAEKSVSSIIHDTFGTPTVIRAKKKTFHSIWNRYTILRFSCSFLFIHYTILFILKGCQQSVYESMPSSFLRTATRCEFSNKEEEAKTAPQINAINVWKIKRTDLVSERASNMSWAFFVRLLFWQ